jgi:hypothetical protein
MQHEQRNTEPLWNNNLRGTDTDARIGIGLHKYVIFVNNNIFYPKKM